jgi:hypothetical protein
MKNTIPALMLAGLLGAVSMTSFAADSTPATPNAGPSLNAAEPQQGADPRVQGGYTGRQGTAGASDAAKGSTGSATGSGSMNNGAGGGDVPRTQGNGAVNGTHGSKP